MPKINLTNKSEVAETRAKRRIDVLENSLSTKIDPFEDLDIIACSEIVSPETRARAVRIASTFVEQIEKDPHQEHRPKMLLLGLLCNGLGSPQIKGLLMGARQRLSRA